MNKFIALIVFSIAAYMAVSYVNDLADQYNTLTTVQQSFTQAWCRDTTIVKTLQDHLDCTIIDHL